MAIWEEENSVNNWDDAADWTEDQWEAFFQEQDRRADYFLKKFEQSLKKYEAAGTPDPVEAAFNELFAEIEGAEFPEVPAEIDDTVNESDVEAEVEYEPEEPPWTVEEFEEELDDFHNIYAYQIAYEFAILVNQFVKPLYDTPFENESIRQLHYHGYQIAAHIAGGHAYGYDRDGIVGNIAKCKRALRSINICLDAIVKIKQTETVLPSQTDTLFQQAIKVRDAVIHRIEDLRSMVWW
ncbi:MAG: hypothetical protein N3A72_03320 [bacterium]|nr:hypothetical protein [bacterium]